MKPTTATTRVTTDARMKIRGTVRPPAIREVCHASLDDGYRCRMPEEPSAVPESSVVVRPEPIDSDKYSVSSRLQAAGLRPAIALFEQAAGHGAASSAAAADRHRRLRRVDRTQLAAAHLCGAPGAAQPDPSRTFDPRGAHRRARQQLHRDVRNAGRGPRHVSAARMPRRSLRPSAARSTARSSRPTACTLAGRRGRSNG